MPWLLRRFGGLRKFSLGVVTVLLAVYLLHGYFIQSSKSSRGSYLNGFRKQDLRNVGSPFPRFIQPTDLNLDVNQSEPEGPRDGLCEELKCGSNEIFYSLSSVIDENKRPVACIGGREIFDPQKLVKGPNLVLFDEKNHTVKDVKYFHLLSPDSDNAFMDYMTQISGQELILLSLWGDVADKIPTDAREILRKFGSERILEYKRGSSFVFLGQKGLAPGHAIEKIGHLTEKDAEAFVQVQGCLQLPLGPIDSNVNLKSVQRLPSLPIGGPKLGKRETIVYGASLPNCGMKSACGSREISISVYSGKHKDDEPKICVDGRFVITRGLNGGGRGLNVVVLNGTAREVVRLGHFDTYAEDSSALEIFLEQMAEDEIIIVVSFDEASNRLSNMGKQMFYELGSGLVQNLKFRASWFFIGQKGLTGFTPFEELNFATGNEWAKPVDQRICIPGKLDGRKVRPDPSLREKNDARRHFCEKYDGYEEFCGEQIDEQLSPAPLYNRSLEGHPIFSVPILVVAGLSHNSLRLSLETLLRQSGINPKMVLVTYDENYDENKALTNLFGFRALPVPSPPSYMDQVKKSLEMAWKEFPAASALIVLEEELVVTADFLLFMAQLLPLLLKDPTLLSVSAWNDNGFEEVSSLPGAVYREEMFPGMGFMIRRDTYNQLISKQEDACCMRRTWDGWLSPETLKGKHSLVPDLSRVFRRHSDGLGLFESRLESLFHRKRAYTHKPESLVEAEYDKELRYSISVGKPLTEAAVSLCLASNGKEPPKLPKSSNPKETFVLYVKQKSADDTELLWKLCRCFGLYHSENQPLRGFYKGLIRFSIQTRPMIIIGSNSPFYSSKPPSVHPLQS